MNNKAKVGIAALAVIATGSLGLALPALAHDRGEREGHSSESHQARAHEDHNRAILDAQVTGIPADVTEARAAHSGAFFTVYLRDSDAASVPQQEPAEDGKRIGIRPVNLESGTPTRTEIEDGTLSGLLGFRAPTELKGKQKEFFIEPLLKPFLGSATLPSNLSLLLASMTSKSFLSIFSSICFLLLTSSIFSSHE